MQRLPLDLLRPLAAAAMEMNPANSKVENVRNDGEKLMRSAGAAAEDGALPLSLELLPIRFILRTDRSATIFGGLL